MKLNLIAPRTFAADFFRRRIPLFAAVLVAASPAAIYAQSVSLGGAQTPVGGGLFVPQGVAVDAAGDVFIADTVNNRVVEVPAGGGHRPRSPADHLHGCLRLIEQQYERKFTVVN